MNEGGESGVEKPLTTDGAKPQPIEKLRNKKTKEKRTQSKGMRPF